MSKTQTLGRGEEKPAKRDKDCLDGKTTKVNEKASTSTADDKRAGGTPLTSLKSHKVKSGSYDFVSTSGRQPDLVTELGLTTSPEKEASAKHRKTSHKSTSGRHDDGNASESEPVLLREHRKLPDGDDVITMRPISVTTSVGSLHGSPQVLTHAQKQRMLLSAGKRKPGSSADRIRKIIPEQASLFNEKVKPELNRILNERNASVKPGQRK